MASRRTIVFGYPQNERSVIQVRGAQGEFSLFRLDAPVPPGCTAATDLGFVAGRCDGALQLGPVRVLGLEAFDERTGSPMNNP